MLEVVEDYERTGPIDVDGHYDWGSGDKEVTVAETHHEPVAVECAECYEQAGETDWYTEPTTPEDVLEEVDEHRLRCGGCGHEENVVL